MDEHTMIDQTMGVKLLAGAGKSVLAFISVLLIEPVCDWIILQADSTLFLSQHTKSVLGDLKLIVVLVTAFVVLIKVSISTYKMIRDLRKK